MQLWQDGLIAMLAAVGLASMMWAVVKTVLYRRPEWQQEVVALIPAAGGGEGLEEQMRILRTLRDEREIFGMVLLVDCGLSEEGRKLAKLLARQDRWVTLCQKEDIPSYLT